MPQPAEQGRVLVEVLLPVRNAAPHIAASIKSVQWQTVTDWRLFVLDDGSVDETPRIVEDLASRDSRIQLIRRPATGLVTTLNAGLALCRADYVARQDADDISFPDRFAIQLDYLRQHPDCIAMAGAWIGIDAEGKATGTVHFPDNRGAGDPYWVPAIEPYLPHSFLCARRTAYEAVGGYHHFFHSEDADLGWRMSEIGLLFNTKEVLGKYRLHGNSVSSVSIVNGRIQSLAAQLAAVAAQRRRQGRGDLQPEASLQDRLESARTVEAMLETIRPMLNEREFGHVCGGTTVKLLETVVFRNTALEESDIDFARKVLPRMRPRNKRNLSSIATVYRSTYKRLQQTGRPDLAQRLIAGLRSWLFVRRIPSSIMRRLPSRLAGWRMGDVPPDQENGWEPALLQGAEPKAAE